ncbi:MAG: rhodanese-like domain-containing protein [Acidimicrobiales bacterium]|nr:rhodanese-like domain-containing protein [Acidimicrobiales bacterium]
MATATTLRPVDLDRLRSEHPELRIVDVRTPGEFAGRHIPGSYNVPLPQLAEHRTELTAESTGPVVLVCESGRRAGQAERQLADAGLDRVHVLDGGVAAWESTGLQLVRSAGAAPWGLERQVRLVAGSIVATSIAASTIWPSARYVAGFVGAGLTFAALTDTCAMGMALAKLPYNTRQRGSCDLPVVVSQITETSEDRS